MAHLELCPDSSNWIDVLVGGQPFGKVETYRNPFHSRSCYLNLHLDTYDTSIAEPLFEAVTEKILFPLQVMVSSTESDVTDFLLAGGFERKRRCFELEVTKTDLTVSLDSCAHPKLFQKESPEYEACCTLLYTQYTKNHEAINPLTASFSEFCAELPDTVYCSSRKHFAFVEENEIAYVGSTEPQTFLDFIKGVLADLFSQFETVFFECDDCDETALVLKGLFAVKISESFDTYIKIR